MKSLGNVLLLGDSYTTFKGYIPEGYAAYYSDSETSVTDAVAVEHTWWHQVIEKTGSNLVLNNSWSGSTVCNRGYNGNDSTRSSFITRLDALIDGGFFEENKIDTVLVLGGTNDSWANSPIGEALMYEGWTKDDLYSFLPAMGYLATRLSTLRARVVFISNTELKPEVTGGIKEACAHFGIELLELSKIDKIAGHPGIAGMKKIADQVLAHFEK